MGYLDQDGLTYLWQKINTAIDKKLEGVTAQEVYSTEEQRIGTWIDGKPLYRRVYITTSPSVSGSGNHNILNLDENIYVWKIEGMLVAASEDGSVSPVNFAHAYGAAISCWFKANLHCIYMMVGVAVQTSRPVYLYLTYTKTTDTATKQISAQSDAVIKLSNSALDITNIPSAPVTAATAGVEIAGMEEV